MSFTHEISSMKFNRLFLIILLLVLVAVLIEAKKKQTNKKKPNSKPPRKETDQGKRKQTNRKQPKRKPSRKQANQTKKKHKDKQYREKHSNNNKNDCVVSPWGNWTPARPCVKDCKEPCLVKRTRKVNRRPQKSGKKCPELLQRTKKQLCKSRTDCAVGPWTGWSHCRRTCGIVCETRQTRKVVRKPGKKSGTRCPSLVKKRTNKLSACPEPTCEVTYWSSWSSCGRTCEGSCHRSRVRNILRNPSGKPCPKLIEYGTKYLGSCPGRPMPVNCQWDHWENWSKCSKTCGESCTITRHRHHKQIRRGRGRDCVGPKEDAQEVHLDECPTTKSPVVDCEVGSWGPWTGASCTCGQCSSSRSRTIITPAQGGGSPCGSLQEQKHEDHGSCNVEIQEQAPEPEVQSIEGSGDG